MASSRNSESPDPLPIAVASCLRRHVAPGQLLIVGFSGGRDSTALLHALHGIQADLSFRLAACHVNHAISPHAAQWETACRRFCAELELPLEIMQVDVPRHAAEGLEAAARTQRYAAFAKLSADWLVLGQHRGDQAETLLFNLLRGAGLAGAAGMPATRWIKPGMQLIRPLLGVAREDIDGYLASHALQWVEDESNADSRYSRNFLRHQVLPLLRSRFPATEQKLAAFAGRFAEASVLLDELALTDLAGAAARFPVPLTRLAKLSEPRARNLLRFLLIRHGARIPSEERLTEAVRQLLEAMPDRHPKIAFGAWQLVRKRGEVDIEPVQTA